MMTSSYSSTSSYRLTFSQLSIEKQITSCFLKTYYITENYYNSRMINDIIYNEKSHIVSLFKDNLIIDDCSEFLKRYYTTDESQLRLPRFFEYHETYSRIYPNYTAIPESKYIYKNIHKKQKIIDQQQNMEMSVEKKNHKRRGKDSKCNNNNNNYDKQVFSTEVCYSLANDSSLMRSIFGLAKKRHKASSNKNINSERDNNNNGNASVNEVEKLINIIDKHQRALNVHGSNGNTIKHKKNISSCNHRHHHSSNNSNNGNCNYTSSTTRGKQPIHGLSKIYTDSLGNTITTHNNKYNTIITSSHQITLSNHNINEHTINTNTILNYNNNTYKITQHQHTTRLPTKHITTLSKDIHKKVNELHLPKSSSATGNNSMINHTHRKTNSAYNAGCCYCCTKEKIKVNTASAKATFEAESIKNRIKRLSSKNNNNNGKITYRNRIIPNKNNTLGVRTTNNSLNSYNKTNQTHCSTIKSNKHLPIKNSTIYTTTSHIIKRLIPQSSKNRKGSTSCKRKNGSGAKTERIVGGNNNNNMGEHGQYQQQQQQQNAFEIALLKQLTAKTKSNSQTKGNNNNNNEYKPILSARGSSSIIGRINNNNSKHKGSKHVSNSNSNSNSKHGGNKILKSNNEKKISVNTLNKNTYHYKSSNTSQKNILTPNTIHDEHNTQYNNKHTNIVKGIQIKNFNKVIALASSSTDHKTIDNNYSDNSRSNSNNNKAINVNIKTANTKYLSQTTRNIHHRRSDV